MANRRAHVLKMKLVQTSPKQVRDNLNLLKLNAIFVRTKANNLTLDRMSLVAKDAIEWR